MTFNSLRFGALMMMMMDMDLLSRSVPEEGLAQLDAGYVL